MMTMKDDIGFPLGVKNDNSLLWFAGCEMTLTIVMFRWKYGLNKLVDKYGREIQ